MGVSFIFKEDAEVQSIQPNSTVARYVSAPNLKCEFFSVHLFLLLVKGTNCRGQFDFFFKNDILCYYLTFHIHLLEFFTIQQYQHCQLCFSFAIKNQTFQYTI